jgi:hypothetical protein
LLPARSPNLNAFAERWVRSIKSEQWMTQMARHAVDESDGAFRILIPECFGLAPKLRQQLRLKFQLKGEESHESVSKKIQQRV